MNLVLTDTGCAFIHAVGIAEIGIPDIVPVDIAPERIHAMTALWRQTIKFKATLPQEIFRFLDLRPRQLNISNGSFVPVFGIERNAIIIGSNIRIGTHNNVWKIRSRLRSLAMNDKVFPVLDGLGNIRIRVEASRIGIEGLVLVDLFPKSDTRISSKKHERPTRR